MMNAFRPFEHESQELEMIEVVCKALRIDKVSVTSKNRTREYTDARFVLYRLLRDRLNMTYKEIGKLFNRDRVSVFYGIQTANELIEAGDKMFIEKFTKANEALTGANELLIK